MKKETPWTPHEVEMALEMAGLYIGKSRNTKRNVGISSSMALANALNKVIQLEADENVHERNAPGPEGRVQPGRNPSEVVGTVMEPQEQPGAKVRNIRDVKPINGQRH